ncbi:MAG: IS21-like element helper ATPase IstB [Fidelibacterota bacterium]
MANEATFKKMSEMKLHGMRHAFRATMETGFAHNFTTDELIAHLVDAEWEDRTNRRLTRLIKAAGFRHQASFEHIDFVQKRNLDKNICLRLSTCDWIKKGENILITGSTGVGKSYLACAFGQLACINGFKVFYRSSMKLFSKLKFAKADGTYIKELKKIQNQNLIILDDFGLHPMDQQSKLILLEILEDRYGDKSTIITSQFPVTKWHDVIASPTIADAICDRLVHNSIKIDLKGESMRKKIKNNSG